MKPTYHWPALDWSLSDYALARQTGAHKKTVAAARARLGKPPRPKRRVLDFSRVDWTRDSVREVAKRKRCSYHAAQRARRIALGESRVVKTNSFCQ